MTWTQEPATYFVDLVFLNRGLISLVVSVGRGVVVVVVVAVVVYRFVVAVGVAAVVIVVVAAAVVAAFWSPL